ncbi:hypothetical protein Dvina_05605 [Dactylosporangium vinaceum]|uniref:Uncharacterized protein n=1 Tax=Dactylosporangium vinaceum TaxID=53362 RepID=A0ABV5MII1_9ACTN|nr:hypothetical protein [Dactylosporangium vinaceum]UAB97618.1 hypothetical protein Dvina_05605 [Dactylosporangium vinaceum]
MADLERTSGFDVVRVEKTRFPVVESTALEPLRSRLFRRPKRSLEDLPQLTEGSVFVFHTSDGYASAPEGPKMLGSDVVVRATMVSVVSMRQQEVQVVAALSPSTWGTRLAMRASFNCRVIDPLRVLEDGCWDIRPSLRAYLLEDPKLLMLGARGDVDQNDDVVRRILARTFARKKLEPPLIPGMTVQLIDVDLSLQSDGTVPGPRRSAESSHNGYGHGSYSGGGYGSNDQDFGDSGRDRFDSDPGHGHRRDRYDD